jgi:AcrR family transcriptional regulator
VTLEASEHRRRADAERNRRRLLDAAAAAFAEKGVRCSVDEVAKRAGVGHATVFRHFPTKEALVAAVVKDRIRQVADLAEEALADDDADRALRSFLEQACALYANDRCMIEEAGVVLHDAEVLGEKRRLSAAFEKLVRRAQEAGAVRADVTADDVLLFVRGIVDVASRPPAAPDLWRRHLAVVLAGLRVMPT